MQPHAVCRTLATVLTWFTARLSSPSREVWARAMAAELRYIEHDVEALRWAAGCLYAGVLAQLRGATLLDHRPVRWAVALWAGYEAGDNLRTGSLLISYKLHSLGSTSFLARWSTGDEYRLLYPIFDAVSPWEIGLALAAAALYLLAAVLLLRRHFYAARAFMLALGICGTLWLYELSKPVYFEAFSLRDHLHDALLYGFTGVLAWTVWMRVRTARSSMAGLHE
jgi:hypothetical protein